MIARRDVFQAIADPTRRKIMTQLATNKMNINAIAEEFDMTRQAISLHVKILEECQLISIEKEGRKRICKAEYDQLKEVNDWVIQFQGFWTQKIHALKSVVEQKTKNT